MVYYSRRLRDEVATMTLREAVQTLVLGVGRECRVLRSADLRTLFPHDTTRAFAKGLGHLVEIGLLGRVMRGVYVNHAAESAGAGEVGLLVEAMRPGCLSYLSYESVLADCGTLSQQPYWYTVATTGRGGEYVTPAGRILFRHTSRRDREIVHNTVVDRRYELMVAHPNVALADLRRVYPTMPFDLDMEAQQDAVGAWTSNA